MVLERPVTARASHLLATATRQLRKGLWNLPSMTLSPSNCFMIDKSFLERAKPCLCTVPRTSLGPLIAPRRTAPFSESLPWQWRRQENA
jgi:hypothetical protein